MKLDTKILSLVVVGFVVVSVVLAAYSITGLKRNQTENIQLFKEEFLELGRELFNDSSNLYFLKIDDVLRIATPSSENILASIKAIDPDGKNTIVYNIPSRQFVLFEQNNDVRSLLSNEVLEKIIQENTLNLKNEFDVDNFHSFISDSTGKDTPTKIQLKFYNNLGLIIGYKETFTTGKIRIEFVQRKNTLFFKTYFFSSLIIAFTILIVSILVMTLFMRRVVIKPLRKISIGLEQVKNGKLDTKITISNQDEIGEIASIFNNMTDDLLESKKKIEEYNRTLEQKIEERTAELHSKVNELEKMNKFMVDRELKMIELKNTIADLKKQIAILQEMTTSKT
jgi:HAMP domain-containing protein